MSDCQSGCYKGACLAKVGDSCSNNSSTIYASSDNECYLDCKSGKFSTTATCGHLKVDAYSNKAYWEVYQSLKEIPENIANVNNVYIYASWHPDLQEGDTLITSGVAMSNGINVKPIVIAGGYSSDKDTVVHEYFHLWGGQNYRLYPDWAPFSMIVAMPAALTQVFFGSTDVATPRSYVKLLDYYPEKFTEYNSLDNKFHYNNNPVIGYGNLDPSMIGIGEDFANSAAWYVNEACQLKSNSPTRYDYFKSEVFEGKEYLSSGGCN